MTLDKVTLEDLGRARRVTISKESTTIVARTTRNERRSATASPAIRRELESHGLGVRPREAERADRQAGRRSGRHQGWRPDRDGTQKPQATHRGCSQCHPCRCGGRHCCWRWIHPSAHRLRTRCLASRLEGDQKTGVEIVQRALSAPLRQIAENAGSNGDVVVDRVE